VVFTVAIAVGQDALGDLGMRGLVACCANARGLAFAF
jgi:hypothetical protein